jgi:hypothetical protein
MLISGSQGQALQDEDEEGKAHRELGEDVMKSHCEGKMKAMDGQSIGQGDSFLQLRLLPSNGSQVIEASGPFIPLEPFHRLGDA